MICSPTPLRLKTCILAAIVGIGNVLLANPLQAGLLTGKEMQLTIAWPTTDFIQYVSPPFVVGDGIEFSLTNKAGFAWFDLDISDDTITFNMTRTDFFLTADFNGYILKDLSHPVAPFEIAHVAPTNTLAGFSNSRITHDDHNLYLNVSGLPILAGDKLAISVASVPEPGGMVLAIVGAIGLAAYGLRRKPCGRPIWQG
ncbi:MAG: hypothetical protein K2Y37_02740 [Pirellulales bacterium]|nr:hypothetical protein [Pirellulales bacterium]